MASTRLQSRPGGYTPEIDDAERASRDEIMALQTRRLAWSLAHAYDNVAHYRRAFDQAGVHPADFRELADLAKFPFTVKTDLRDNYPFNMFAVPREKLVRVHASSGTTGKPIVVGYTKADIEMWSERDGALDPCRRRPQRHDHPQRLWLWPVHRRPRRALRRRAARLHGGARFPAA